MTVVVASLIPSPAVGWRGVMIPSAQTKAKSSGGKAPAPGTIHLSGTFAPRLAYDRSGGGWRRCAPPPNGWVAAHVPRVLLAERRHAGGVDGLFRLFGAQLHVMAAFRRRSCAES